MANELLLVTSNGLNSSEQDMASSTLTVGTEQVNAEVAATEIGIVIGSSVNVSDTGMVEEMVYKMIQYWRENGMASGL